jgi:hypothetical protein
LSMDCEFCIAPLNLAAAFRHGHPLAVSLEWLPPEP